MTEKRRLPFTSHVTDEEWDGSEEDLPSKRVKKLKSGSGTKRRSKGSKEEKQASDCQGDGDDEPTSIGKKRVREEQSTVKLPSAHFSPTKKRVRANPEDGGGIISE
jgi:hypothetical protein